MIFIAGNALPVYPLLFSAMSMTEIESINEASASRFSCDPSLSRTHAHTCVRRAFIEEAHAPHPSGVAPRISRLSRAVLRQWHVAPVSSRKRSGDSE